MLDNRCDACKGTPSINLVCEHIIFDGGIVVTDEMVNDLRPGAEIPPRENLVLTQNEIERLEEKVEDLRAYAEQDACEIERLQAEMSAMADWVVNQFGYPLDTTSVDAPSVVWRQLIEDAWLRNEPGLSTQEQDSMRIIVAEQGGWVAGRD